MSTRPPKEQIPLEAITETNVTLAELPPIRGLSSSAGRLKDDDCDDHEEQAAVAAGSQVILASRGIEERIPPPSRVARMRRRVGW